MDPVLVLLFALAMVGVIAVAVYVLLWSLR